MGTAGAPYTNPLVPRITIKTIDGDDTLYTFNGFDTDNDISVAQCNMENAIGETGTFNILINDHNNVIPKDNIHNVKVFLELGKTEATLQHFLIGYGDLFDIDRPGTNVQFYNLSGFGSKIWAYQLYIHRRETYKRNESDAKIYNIIDNALTKRLWRPLKKQDESIQDITGWSKDGISTKVNIPFTVIDKPFTYFGDLCDELADITGAVWFIDVSTGEEVFTFKYNPDLATKTVIKSGDLADRTNDNADRISYIKSAFNIQDASSAEAGTYNRLFSATIQDNQEMFPLDNVNYAKGLTNTTFKAIAQQIIIDNDARRIEEIELKLKKIGDPSSPKDRINGDIVLDKNNTPTGSQLDEFHIGLGSIEENGDFVRVPVDISAKQLDVAQVKIWVRVFQRSNEEDEEDNPDGNGNPNHGTKHTIGWYHNNSFNTTQTVLGTTVRSAQASGGDYDSRSKLSWQTTDKGPTYNVRVYSNIRRLFAMTDGKSKNRIRLRESFVPSDFLNDPRDITRYLSLITSQTSKGRRGIADFRVTVPNNFLYSPYQWVSFNDGLSNIQDMLQVQRASYMCNSGVGDDVPLGTLHANITLSGLYNTLLGACSCL
jgi:hypothetical protein